MAILAFVGTAHTVRIAWHVVLDERHLVQRARRLWEQAIARASHCRRDAHRAEQQLGGVVRAEEGGRVFGQSRNSAVQRLLQVATHVDRPQVCFYIVFAQLARHRLSRRQRL